MKKYAFTKAEILKIKCLNAKLKEQEQRIKQFVSALHLSLKAQRTDKQIDDYNFTTCLQVFSNNEACNKRHNIEEGDPFYEDKSYVMFGDFTDEGFYNDDWNEGKHQLKHLHFCYTMHCLTFHSNLSWQDILDIDDIWIELKIDYQFMIKM